MTPTTSEPVNGNDSGTQSSRSWTWILKRRRLPWDSWANGKAGELLGADLRSLAMLRILLALIVALDMAMRLPDLRVFYTDEGVMPRSLVTDGGVRWRWSIAFANDTYGFQLALFLATIAAAMAMMLGYRTRLATVIVWVLVVSIQARNPFVLSGADSLLRVLLFWAMFLPLGAVWSIDAYRQADKPRLSMRFLSFGTIGIFLQIGFMYWFTAILKSSPAWRSDGTALYYALNAGHITRPFGEYLSQFPELLRVLTHASLALEVLAPVLLFSPFLTGPLRTLAVASVMAFHLGIFLTMDVGIFPWTSASCMVCFLPSWFWDTLLRGGWDRLPRGLRDDLQRLGRLPAAAAAQWNTARSRLATGHLFLAGAGLPGHHAASTRPVVASRDDHRATTTARDSPVLTLVSHPLTNLFLAGCLVFVFLWNLTSVTSFAMPPDTRPFAYGTGLYQKWNMFAPSPSRSTVWVVVRGVLADGREFDLLTPIVHDDLTHVPVLSWSEPDDIVGKYYGSKYWRKYLTALVQDNRTDERRSFAAYACRTWNGYYGGDAHLVGLQIIQMSTRTLPSNEAAPIVRDVVAQYRCS
jgi:hypothetical protein